MELPFRIEKKESFRVVGYRLRTTNRKGEGRKAIPLHWAKMKEAGFEKVSSCAVWIMSPCFKSRGIIMS